MLIMSIFIRFVMKININFDVPQLFVWLVLLLAADWSAVSCGGFILAKSKMTLVSLTCCSLINILCLRYVHMYSASQQSMCGLFWHAFIRVILISVTSFIRVLNSYTNTIQYSSPTWYPDFLGVHEQEIQCPTIYSPYNKKRGHTFENATQTLRHQTV